MKKITLLYLCLVMLLCYIEADAQAIHEKDVMGTWKINLDDSQKLNLEKNNAFKPISERDKANFESIQIEFGTGAIYKLLNGANKNASGERQGTWKLEGDKLLIKTEEEESTLIVIGKGSQELTVFDTRAKTYWVFISSIAD